MANVALGKSIKEEQVENAVAATDGQITGYTGNTGFAYFRWPGTLTVDLDNIYRLSCIRMLLWDGLGQGGGPRDPRNTYTACLHRWIIKPGKLFTIPLKKAPMVGRFSTSPIK